MDRPHIVAEITRIALANDGKAPGREKFERESGIKMHEWYPHLWLRWGDALQEAGFAPNKLVIALSNDVIVEKYIELIRELGRLPLDGEVRRKGKQDSSFPSHSVFARFGGKPNLVAKILEYCKVHSGFDDVLTICENSPQRGKKKEESSRAPIQGYVYMMRSGRRYKIGHTSSPARRHREVRLDLRVQDCHFPRHARSACAGNCTQNRGGERSPRVHEISGARMTEPPLENA